MIRLSCLETIQIIEGFFFFKMPSEKGRFYYIMCNNHSIKLEDLATGQILTDKKKNGKNRPWSQKKRSNLIMANHFDELYRLTRNDYYLKKANRLRECAETLVFKFTDNTLKLFQTWFCKVRLCAMCAWRRSLKIAYHNKRIVETVNERENVKWLFLTLTVKNMDAESLPETVSGMFKAFNRLTKYKAFKTSVRGFFRALEITRNRDSESESFGSYHPHFHVLLCVPSSYFSKKEFYIKQSDWTALWQRAMKLDYKPIVNIKRVKPKENLNDWKEELKADEKAIKEQNAILEVSKYPVKDSDIIQGKKVTEENLETVETFDSVLADKRLIGYGGLLKEIHKELNLGDAEDGDLINISEDDDISNGAFEVMAKWNMQVNDYVIQ